MDIESEVREQIKKLENDQFIASKKCYRWIVIIGTIFLVVMILIIIASLLFLDSTWIIELQKTNASYTRNVDYLQLVTPILIAIGGFFIAFLGMNRLKDFDNQIAEVKKDVKDDLQLQKSELIAFRREISDSLNYEKNEIAVARTALGESVQSRVEREVSIQQSKYTADFATHSDELLGKIDIAGTAFLDMIRDEQRKTEKGLARLEKYFGVLESISISDFREIEVHTVEAAHKRVEKLCREKPDGYPEYIHYIVERVCEEDKPLYGDSADYHNLAAELGRESLYSEAVDVCSAGLKRLKIDEVDLLADIVQYSTRIGEYEKANNAIARLNKSAVKRLWNWRAFEFLIDYYRATGDLEIADRLCDEFLQKLPTIEYAYCSKAEIAKVLIGGKEGIDSAIEWLKKALNANINCAQCARQLAEEYSDLGMYDDAIKAADRAVMELAQEQPHVNASFVFYLRAYVKDRQFMRLLTENTTALLSDTMRRIADESYQDYNIALELGMLTQGTNLQAQTRKQILKRYVSEDIVSMEDLDRKRQIEMA